MSAHTFDGLSVNFKKKGAVILNCLIAALVLAAAFYVMASIYPVTINGHTVAGLDFVYWIPLAAAIITVAMLMIYSLFGLGLRALAPIVAIGAIFGFLFLS